MNNIRRIKNKIKRFFNPDAALRVDDQQLIDSFLADEDFPFLISFPRTGSHWLRMIMELYFEKPSLVRAFYFRDAKDFTCFHRHDVGLDIFRKNVIYLYRNPVETIYSLINYHKEDLNDSIRREYWSQIYGRHLAKWLINDEFTKKKTVISYEGMKADMPNEFEKICRHLGQEFNNEKLQNVLMKVSKDELKKKTTHDKQVVNLSENYGQSRQEFKQRYEQEIFTSILSVEPRLAAWLR